MPTSYFLNALTLFALLCVALSVVTRILFRPKTFYAPANRLSRIISIVYILSFGALFAMSKMPWLPIELSSWASDCLSLPTSWLVIMTHGQAIHHHFENATRTPRDWWEKFFSG